MILTLIVFVVSFLIGFLVGIGWTCDKMDE